MNPIVSFLSGLVSPVTKYLGKRSDNKTAIKTQQIERISNADDKLAEWERVNAENANTSWKDEWFTLLLSIPAILAFIPDMVPHVTAGFAALSSMPDFYQYWLSVAVGASFGVRMFKK